jgi:hypothetical protein
VLNAYPRGNALISDQITECRTEGQQIDGVEVPPSGHGEVLCS